MPRQLLALLTGFLVALALVLALDAAAQHHTTPWDTLPAFGSTPTITAIASGTWSEPATWSAGRLPDATDVVAITGQTVLYDMAASGIAQTVAISGTGTLVFATDRSTRLDVTTLFVGPGGTLDIGTDASPLPPQHTAEIVIRDIPIDTILDPAQYGTGLLVLDGTLRLYGAPRTPFMRLAAEPAAGATTLTLAGTVTGWTAGDTLVLPDSRQMATANAQTASQQTEWGTVAQVNGTILTLQTKLNYGHPGAKNSLSGALEFLPHVAHLSRNIVIRSENPTGTRGHVWLSRKSTIDLQHVRFAHLSRTTTAALHSTTFDAQGKVVALGKNQIGRYAIHLHHLVGPSQPIGGYQYRLIGNVIDGGLTPHPYKWSIVLHDSHYGLIQGNVMVQCGGACLMTEDGSETGNVIEGNIAIRATGVGDRMGMGIEPSGYWWRGGQNIVRRNVATGMTSGGRGAQNCGYSIFQHKAGTVRLPAYQGADTSVAGQYITQSLYALPLREFVDNEAYHVTCGITVWWLGINYLTPAAQDDSVIRGLKVWNVFGSPYINYQSHRVVLDGLVVRGSPLDAGCCHMGYDGRDYLASDFTIRNSSIHGVLDGIVLSTSARGTYTIADTELVYKRYGIVWQTIGATSGLASLTPRHTVVDNVRFAPIPGSAQATWKTLQLQYLTLPGRDPMMADTIEVRNYQGKAGDDFHAYYVQQAPDFVLPQEVRNTNGTLKTAGAPEPGLTNTQALAEHNLAFAGSIAPCQDRTTRPEISGFTCGPQVPPPPVVTPGQALFEQCRLAEPWDTLTVEKQQQWEACAE
jgi:hypothetical protein